MLIVRQHTSCSSQNGSILLPGGLVCTVDLELLDFLKQFPWRFIPSGNKSSSADKFSLKSLPGQYIQYGNKGYAGFGKRINGKYHLIRMHRLITQAPSWMKVHHDNHNRFDNLRNNLRLVTEREHRHFDGWHIFYR